MFSFSNFLAFIPVDEQSLVPLRIQFLEDRLVVMAAPGKGEMVESEALLVAQGLHHHLQKNGIDHESMYRDHKLGRRIDMVVVPLPKRHCSIKEE